MMNAQRLPAAGPAREKLREKGQFWTPAWLAVAMATWVSETKPRVLFDPAVGPGTFFLAARKAGFTGQFAGREIDSRRIDEALGNGLTQEDMADVVLGDFISDASETTYPAIISNPPYIRHHRLSPIQKAKLRQLSINFLGFPLDGRVGLHVYFFLKCLRQLEPGGRLAFLLPADVCEGVSAKALWTRLATMYRIDAVITFSPDAAPFPAVDTNAMVLLLSHCKPAQTVRWVSVRKPTTQAVLGALLQAPEQAAAAVVHERELTEILATGPSRAPRNGDSAGVPLSHFARVMRGIATGANEFFFLTSSAMRDLRLDERYFIRAIGRTRDCETGVLEPTQLAKLDSEGRPTWLLSLGGEPKETLPDSLRTYINSGEAVGLHQRALIQMRRPWYKMEQREVPPILFSYLGRRHCRFIRNLAGAVPLTGFLCIYPKTSTRKSTDALWKALNDPRTLTNLAMVGKSYGGGAIKAEPRQLDLLELPFAVVADYGLSVEDFNQPTTQQFTLWG